LKSCFEFTEELSSGLGAVYRPLMKVGLKDADGTIFEISMIVDSGADITVL